MNPQHSPLPPPGMIRKSIMMRPLSPSACWLRSGRWIIGFVGLLWGVASPFLLAAPVPSAEQLLPDDTLVVGCVPDCVQVGRLIEQAPLGQFWRAPVMKSFRDEFVARCQEEFVKPLERDLGIRFRDYTTLLQGQLVFALTQDGWDGITNTSPAFLLLLDTRDQSDQLRTNLAAVRQQWVETGKAVRTEKIRDVEFMMLQVSRENLPAMLQSFLPERRTEQDPDAEAPPAKSVELVVGQFESLLILGTSPRVVDKVMTRLTGGNAPTLAGVPAFEADWPAQLRDTPAYVWVHARRLMDALRKIEEAPASTDRETSSALEIPALLRAAGFNGLNTVAAHYRDTPVGRMLQVHLAAPAAERSGLFKLLATESQDAAPPPFVPADVLKFQRLRIDGPKAWAVLEKMAGEISPQFLNVLNFFLQTADRAGKERDARFDVRKDLISSLGDDWIRWQKSPPDPEFMQLEDAPSVVLIGSPHATKLAVTLRNLFAVSTPALERDFLGRKIYTVTPPTLGRSDDPSGGPQKLHYAAGGNYVGFSQEAELVEEWLRSLETPPQPLLDAAGFRDSIQQAGGAAGGWLTYENTADRARWLWETAKEDAEDAEDFDLSGWLPAPLALIAEGVGVLDWCDFTLLPAWETVAKYFYHTVTSADANEAGITVRFYRPTPPGLRKSPPPEKLAAP